MALTFDDGPVPEQTPWVLDTLDKHGIRATFFCVGDNVRKHPELFAEIKKRGHVTGNHTFNHVQLFRQSWKDYKANAEQCTAIEEGAKFFRPPHGQMLPWRARQLGESFERLIFWDVMPKDYDKSLKPERVFENVKDFVRDGSIIVFHDSIKAGERMRYALEKSIETLTEEGYSFVTVDKWKE